MIDKIFKLGVLVLGILYILYLYYPLTSQNERYKYFKHNAESSILDTYNGTLYRSTLRRGNNEVWMKFDPKTGKQTYIRN